MCNTLREAAKKMGINKIGAHALAVEVQREEEDWRSKLGT